MSVALLISPALGQATPAVTSAPTYEGFQLPSIPGTLTYSLSGSERVERGAYAASSPQSLSLGGNLGLLSASPTHPFSMIYSGGYLIGEGSGQSYGYQNLTMSQQYTTRNWQFLANDELQYTPETSTVDLSGVPGVGNGGSPTSGSAGDILTYDESRISNTTSGSAFRNVTGRTSVGAQGDYAERRFLGSGTTNSIYNNNSWSIGPLVRYQLDPLNLLTGAYSYTEVSYGGLLGNLILQSATLELQRRWTRKLSTTLGGGPQHVSGSGYNYTLQGSAQYDLERGSASLNFSHGVQDGGGVSAGIRQTSVAAALDRQLGYEWSGSVSAGYRDSTELSILTVNPNEFRSVYATAQMNRALARHVSAFASYTMEHQSEDAANTSSVALKGLVQIFSFGITYTPSSLHFGRQ